MSAVVDAVHRAFQKQLCMQKKAGLSDSIKNIASKIPVIKDLSSKDPQAAAKALRILLTGAGGVTGGVVGAASADLLQDDPSTGFRIATALAGAGAGAGLANALTKYNPQIDKSVTDAAVDAATSPKGALSLGALGVGSALWAGRRVKSNQRFGQILAALSNDAATGNDNALKLLQHSGKYIASNQKNSLLRKIFGKVVPKGGIDIDMLRKDLSAGQVMQLLSGNAASPTNVLRANGTIDVGKLKDILFGLKTKHNSFRGGGWLAQNAAQHQNMGAGWLKYFLKRLARSAASKRVFR